MALNEAKSELLAWQQKIVWKRSFGRPFRMQEIQIEALLLAWEVLAAIQQGAEDHKRLGEMRKRHAELSGGLGRMVGLPVMARSFEHRVSLTHAQWTLDVLVLVLDLWETQDTEPPKARQKP